jgi:hypothetical protein
LCSDGRHNEGNTWLRVRQPSDITERGGVDGDGDAVDINSANAGTGSGGAGNHARGGQGKDNLVVLAEHMDGVGCEITNLHYVHTSKKEYISPKLE